MWLHSKNYWHKLYWLIVLNKRKPINCCLSEDGLLLWLEKRSKDQVEGISPERHAVCWSWRWGGGNLTLATHFFRGMRFWKSILETWPSGFVAQRFMPNKLNVIFVIQLNTLHKIGFCLVRLKYYLFSHRFYFFHCFVQCKLRYEVKTLHSMYLSMTLFENDETKGLYFLKTTVYNMYAISSAWIVFKI